MENNGEMNIMEKPLSLIVMGMAGTGKTTFVNSLNQFLATHDRNPYVLNLDPAVHKIPYDAHIDIRDSLNYKQVMKEYKLGPNGAIIASLNLFSTQFNDVVKLILQQGGKTNYAVIDTPGQMEVFRWSASGMLITESLSISMPTAILYLIDTPKCSDPTVFMSNMLYASGIAVEFEIPIILVANKMDILDWSFIDTWMSDVMTFVDEVDQQQSSSEYLTTPTTSLAFVMDKFYKDLPRCGVSCVTGDGFHHLVNTLLPAARVEYETDFVKNVLPERILQASKSHKELMFEKAPGGNANGDEDSDSGSDDEEDDAEFAANY